jgi:hypothetical protein
MDDMRDVSIAAGATLTMTSLTRMTPDLSSWGQLGPAGVAIIHVMHLRALQQRDRTTDRSADPPSTILATYTLAVVGSCWKNIPTPAISGRSGASSHFDGIQPCRICRNFPSVHLSRCSCEAPQWSHANHGNRGHPIPPNCRMNEAGCSRHCS